MPVTLLPRITVDFERLMKSLLTYPGLAVAPAVDVDSLEDVPLLTFVGGNGRMISNGHPGAGWEWTLFLTLFADGIADGAGLADTIYQVVHGWDPGSYSDDFADFNAGVVPGVGSVSSVEDLSMFDRVGGGTLPDKQIVQFNASFLVRVRPS